MKLRLIAAAVAALALTAGNAAAQDTSTEKGKLSYALGYDAGNNLAQLQARGEQLDVATVVKGLQDALAQREPAVPVDQLRTAVENMQKRQAEKAKAAWEKASTENQTRSTAFLAENKAKAGVQTLPNGVQYRVIESGTGAQPSLSSTVELQVTGPFPWGERPEQVQPQTIPAMKLSQVEMPVMREVLQKMKEGAKWEVTLPPDQAYGADPRTGFPPNVAVQFEIKLLSVK
jgi:peptidylprolyl isomerase